MDTPLEDRVRRRLAEFDRGRRTVDLVINANELTTAHGTGVLLGRVLKDAPEHVLFRAFSSWGGTRTTRPVAEYAFDRYSRPRTEIAEFISARLPPWDVRGILSVPYTREDVVMAIAAKSITGSPLAIWVMDDNTLVADGVPRELTAELVRMADARFAISPALQRLYASAYGVPFHILPPLVASDLLRCGVSAGSPATRAAGRSRSAMVGNVWSQSWFNRTLDVLSQIDVATDWYTSADHIDFLDLDAERLARAQVSIRPGLDARETARRVAEADFVIAPSTDLTEATVQAASIGRLSLPSKLPFITATAGAPLLILADGPSAAGDYVRRFDLGAVSPYDPTAVQASIAELVRPERRAGIRRRSFELASAFDVAGAYRLLMDSASDRRLIDDRFERLFSAHPDVADSRTTKAEPERRAG